MDIFRCFIGTERCERASRDVASAVSQHGLCGAEKAGGKCEQPRLAGAVVMWPVGQVSENQLPPDPFDPPVMIPPTAVLLSPVLMLIAESDRAASTSSAKPSVPPWIKA